jgi:hypothetical protein
MNSTFFDLSGSCDYIHRLYSDEDEEDNKPEVKSDFNEMDVDVVDEDSVNYKTFADQKYSSISKKIMSL